jgi:glycosyltransferase involved in cell wall biosynthesis
MHYSSRDDEKMVFNSPIVSIGIPVYNGQNFLRQALDSVLGQTFKNFEIIISDNASTDKTQQICHEYSRKDSRVRYYRNKRNLGAPWNYNRVFRLSSGMYFKWASHDDIIAPEYLQKCVNILDADPTIVLCHSKIGIIDENGVIVGNLDHRILRRIGSLKPHERFADFISRVNSCWDVFGVVRADSFRKTQLHGNYIGADRNLLAEIGLMGRVYEIPEHLFFRRDHPDAYTNVYYSKPTNVRNYQKELTWWTGNRSRSMAILPYWKLTLEFAKSIKRAKLSSLQRVLSYRELTAWLLREGRFLLRYDLTNMFKLWRIRLNGGSI